MVAIIITHLTEQCIDTLQARSGSQARCACRATPAARMSAEGRGGDGWTHDTTGRDELHQGPAKAAVETPHDV